MARGCGDPQSRHLGRTPRERCLQPFISRPIFVDLELAVDTPAVMRVRVANLPGCSIEIVRDSAVLANVAANRIEAADHEVQFMEVGDGRRHWIRANARDRDGRLVLIGNPIYVNWRARR